MSNRGIGRIIAISNNRIFAELYADSGNYLNTIDGIRFVGEISSYVSIEESTRKIIAEVNSIEEKHFATFESMSKPTSNRVISLNLIGEIIDRVFTFGVSKMPFIFSEISIINEKDLNTMLEIGSDEAVVSTQGNISDKEPTRVVSLKIASSVIFPDYDVKVNVDRFFGFHFSVFGNTGSGKSNTIALIMQNIFAKKNHSAYGARFIVIDSNGEYQSSFSKLEEQNPEIKVKYFTTDDSSKEENFLEIPVWALSADDWAVLLHASEKTQIPIIRRALSIARVFYGESDFSEDLKNHILASTVMGILNSSESSPSKSDKIKAIITTFGTKVFSMNTVVPAATGADIRTLLTISYGEIKGIIAFQEFCKNLIQDDLEEKLQKNTNATYDIRGFKKALEFAVLYEGSISSQRIQEYTATLSARLQALIESDQGKILAKTTYTGFEEYVDSIFGKNQIVNIDISNLDDATGEVVIKVLTKLVFDYLKKRPLKAEMPVNLIIEEAHRFVKNSNYSSALNYDIFERVAKEGRKYGFLMGVSSQRPSELSKTVVSQCSNFIIHRIQNPDDLNYITRMVPYINEGIINRLTYLQTGHALIFGSAINIPTLASFKRAEPPTDSHNARISEKWYIEVDKD